MVAFCRYAIFIAILLIGESQAAWGLCWTFWNCDSTPSPPPSWWDESKSIVQQECNNLESFPERVCGAVIRGVKSRMDEYCGWTVDRICNDGISSYVLTLLFSSARSCEKKLKGYVCSIGDDAINDADSECTEELQKILIGKGCDSNANEISICDGSLETLNGVCSMIVDEGCNSIPWFLDMIIPTCQVFMSKFICSVA